MPGRLGIPLDLGAQSWLELRHQRPSLKPSSTRSPSAQLNPSPVKIRAGSHTGGVPNCVLTMHAREGLGVSSGIGAAEPLSGRGTGGAVSIGIKTCTGVGAHCPASARPSSRGEA